MTLTERCWSWGRKGRLGYKVDQQDNIQKLPLMIECLSQHRVVDISAGKQA
jgi:hypothetical protein